MKEVIAKHLRKGDLIYYEDSYFVVVSDYKHDYIVIAKCYMSPSSNLYNSRHPINTYKHIMVHEYVSLLDRRGFGRRVSIAYSALKNWIATVRFLV